MDEAPNEISATVGKLHPTIKILLLAVLPALASAIVGLTKSERVDDKAEAGYSFTRGDLEALKFQVVGMQVRIGALETELAVVKKAPRFVIGRKTAAPAVPPTLAPPTPPPPPPPAPTPLPVDLNKALEQTQAEPAK